MQYNSASYKIKDFEHQHHSPSAATFVILSAAKRSRRIYPTNIIHADFAKEDACVNAITSASVLAPIT
jgi:hypothetical protein